MTPNYHFYFYWFTLNLIGFSLGSLHGATSNGFIPSVIPGYAGLIIGDLVFGGMVGFAQYTAIKKTNFIPISNWWIPATSLGFTVGARIGSLLTFRFTDNWLIAGIIFGLFMGGSIGFGTSITMNKILSKKYQALWMAANIAGWVLGESISFEFHFSLKAVPLVTVAIAGISGLGLTYLRAITLQEAQNTD